MGCTVDAKLLNEAKAILGTTSAEETIEASLRRTIGAGRADHPAPPTRIGTAAELAALLERLHSPPSEQELARRRASFEAMERVRVKVGRDFNVAAEIREMHDRVADGLPENEDGRP